MSTLSRKTSKKPANCSPPNPFDVAKNVAASLFQKSLWHQGFSAINLSLMWQNMWQIPGNYTESFSLSGSYRGALLKTDKKRTHQAFLLGEFVANPVDCDTTDGCTLPGAGMGAMHLIQQAHIRIPISNSYYFGRRINAH